MPHVGGHPESWEGVAEGGSASTLPQRVRYPPGRGAGPLLCRPHLQSMGGREGETTSHAFVASRTPANKTYQT